MFHEPNRLHIFISSAEFHERVCVIRQAFRTSTQSMKLGHGARSGFFGGLDARVSICEKATASQLT